ncbi:MAG: DNA-processing protein DprA [Lachnospiraceae bacterium]
MNDTEMRTEWHRECAYAYFWESVEGIGAKSIEKCYRQYGSYQKMYESGGEKALTEKQRAECKKQRSIWNIKEEYKKLRDNKIWCIPKRVSGYPDRLLLIDNPPSSLFVRGKLPKAELPSVAIVGARRCSPYGSTMAKELGRRMAESGIQVISGLASGVDGISQRGALQGKGATFGVLGCGVDICYPEENRDIFSRLSMGESGGGIISEYMPGVQPAAGRFPMRNRIISGLADILIVVEAKEKSGTFITVSSALEQGKDVYVLPGRLGDRLSYGCNRLIAQGAGIIYDLDELIAELLANRNGMPERCVVSGMKAKRVATERGRLGELEERLLDMLEIQYLSVDDIMERLKGEKPVQEVLTALATLECVDLVETEGSFYRKKEIFV